MGLFLPHSERVAIAWIKSVEGIPANSVNTTLPRDNSTWEVSGFVQVLTVGGSPGIDTPISNPVLSIDTWGVTRNSAQAPSGIANQLSERIVKACFGRVDAAIPSAREVDMGPAYMHARVLSAVPLSEPRPLTADEARFAHFSFDLLLSWTPVGVTV